VNYTNRVVARRKLSILNSRTHVDTDGFTGMAVCRCSSKKLLRILATTVPIDLTVRSVVSRDRRDETGSCLVYKDNGLFSVQISYLGIQSVNWTRILGGCLGQLPVCCLSLTCRRQADIGTSLLPLPDGLPCGRHNPLFAMMVNSTGEAGDGDGGTLMCVLGQ